MLPHTPRLAAFARTLQQRELQLLQERLRSDRLVQEKERELREERERRLKLQAEVHRVRCPLMSCLTSLRRSRSFNKITSLCTD